MTTLPPHTHIARRDLSALTAGIPHMIGFPPTNSLVLFTFSRSPMLTMATTIRADLPDPQHIAGMTEHLVVAAERCEVVAMIAVVVGGTLEEHRPLVDTLRKALEDKEITLIHASWVGRVLDGERWQCYLDPQCTDELPDPQASTWAAARAIAGNPMYRDREEMAAQLAPDAPESLARREELLDAHLRHPRHPYTEDDLATDLDLMTQMLTVAEMSPELPSLNDRQIVRLARALSHTEVRDECIAAALSPTPEAAERLWLVLVRALPAPERAEPATLLAMSAYLRSASVLAALAIETALDANPAHDMALMLHAALTHPVPPDHFRELLVKSILRNEGFPEEDDTTEEDDDVPWDTSPEPCTPAPPPPEPLNERTAATLGLLTRDRTTANPLTAFLPTWPL
jgi:hypothetical protein